MRTYQWRTVLLASVLPLGIGCSEKTSIPAPTMAGCSGLNITGTLQDSLTGAPVAQGLAALETVSPGSQPRPLSFSIVEQTISDSQGHFSLCSTTSALPLLFVAVGQDNLGKAYPALIEPVSGSTTLGAVPMGVCRLVCGFDNQVETSLPVTITGKVVSTPTAVTGSIFPQYTTFALDGSGGLWNIAIPVPGSASMPHFATVATGCSSTITPCTSYSFQLPSQNPVTIVSGRATQTEGVPLYSVAADLAPSSSCGLSVEQVSATAGGTLLTGSPGAVEQAQTLSFALCK